MDLQERLLKIEEANLRKKDEKNRLEGRLEGLLQQAQDEFGTSDVKELEKKLENLEADLRTREEELEEKVKGLEEYANK